MLNNIIIRHRYWSYRQRHLPLSNRGAIINGIITILVIGCFVSGTNSNAQTYFPETSASIKNVDVISGYFDKPESSGPWANLISKVGSARFENLPSLITNVLDRKPVFRRQTADAYFDPGFRFNMPIETLAVKWRQWGIRRIHAAAWYYSQKTPYDFKRLIGAAHRNGILVYAWLEWPYVGKKFWDDHTEWRQKNALLQDTHLDFLYLMDLQNPACMQAAMDDLAKLLEYDWDGVDIAEFSITGCGSQALEGPLRPDYFTGFSEIARTEFRKIHGFDQLELFDKNARHYWKNDTAGLNTFYAYRIDVNNRLLKRIVEGLDSLSRLGRRNWEMILTIVDNSLHPEFDQLLGYDVPSIVELIKNYNLTLEVEDPYMEWSKPPERYKRLGEYYRRLLGDHPFMIDINIVPVHSLKEMNYANAQPTGTEFIQLWKMAAEQSPRVCFYSESTVFTYDWEMLPFAMAAKAVIRKDPSGWHISTPNTATLTGLEQSDRLLLDDLPWPCYSDEGIIIPLGEHRLTVRDTNGTAISGRSGMRLISISGELQKCCQNKDGLELKYDSELRCILVLNEQPSMLLLDGAISDLPVLGAEGRWAVVTPPGVHVLTVISR